MKKEYLFLPLILMVNLNFILSQCTSGAPAYNDDALNKLQFDAMNIPCSWTITEGSTNIVVGIIDDYFDDDHEDLVFYNSQTGMYESVVVDILGGA